MHTGKIHKSNSSSKDKRKGNSATNGSRTREPGHLRQFVVLTTISLLKSICVSTLCYESTAKFIKHWSIMCNQHTPAASFLNKCYAPATPQTAMHVNPTSLLCVMRHITISIHTLRVSCIVCHVSTIIYTYIVCVWYIVYTYTYR